VGNLFLILLLILLLLLFLMVYKILAFFLSFFITITDSLDRFHIHLLLQHIRYINLLFNNLVISNTITTHTTVNTEIVLSTRYACCTIVIIIITLLLLWTSIVNNCIIKQGLFRIIENLRNLGINTKIKTIWMSWTIILSLLLILLLDRWILTDVSTISLLSSWTKSWWTILHDWLQKFVIGFYRYRVIIIISWWEIDDRKMLLSRVLILQFYSILMLLPIYQWWMKVIIIRH
jgi:hypothetical protein